MSNNKAHEALVDELLIHLSTLGLGRFWKNPRGVAMTRSGQVMTFGTPGQADITGILKGGYRPEIEVKTGTGRLETDQRNFRDMIQTWDGFHHQARNVEGTVEAIKSFLENKNL